MPIYLPRESSTLHRLPYPRGMPSLYTRAIFYLFIFATLCGKSSAFLSGTVSRLHRRYPITATSRTSYTNKLHSRGMLGAALRMVGEEDSAESPEATAKRLAEQAAVLREEVAAREAELRPPEQTTKDAEEPAPKIRPEDMPPTIKISDEMKSRLRQELISQGADPNKSAGNPILVISAIIAVLVIIGGKGIFY